MKSFSIVLAILLFVASPLLVWADGSLRGSNTTFTNTMERKERKLAVDDRKPLNQVTPETITDGTKWLAAVGLVETGSRSCTGVLVGPDLLLTTQSCGHKYQPDGSIGWLRFTPAKHDGIAPFGTAKGTFWFSHAPHIGKQNSNSNYPTNGFEKAFNYYDDAFDYVLVKLDSRIGDTVGWWCFKHIECDDSTWTGVNKIGYASDLNNKVRPYYQDGEHKVFGCEWHTNDQGVRSVTWKSDFWSSFYLNDVIFGLFGGNLCVIGLSTGSDFCDWNGSYEASLSGGICSQVSGGPGLEDLIKCVNSEENAQKALEQCI